MSSGSSPFASSPVVNTASAVPPSSASAPPQLTAVLAFDANNRLAIRRLGSKCGLAFTGSDLAMATQRLAGAFREYTTPTEYFSTTSGGRRYQVCFTQVEGASADAEIEFWSLDQLAGTPAALAPSLAGLLPGLEPHLIALPYLHLGENDFIYKFRPEKNRNQAIYAQDDAARSLYQSQLCSAIKALARQHERSATAPVELDFGAVRYVIPSHFGFCLGVKNAIERAYETLAENPHRRVFMLSELIHNPFVNDDLLRRGLRYLQSDKGTPFTTAGTKAAGASDETLLWDTLTPDDIVIIPAFGATDDDKRRLVRKGVAVAQHDATCMLVEKVWKAARAYGREGFTVIIHGKAEHEETKATFSNTRRHAPAVIVRHEAEARALGEIIAAVAAAERGEQAESTDPAAPSSPPEIAPVTAAPATSRSTAARSASLATAQARFELTFAGKHTPGFDVGRDLQRVAVVNQTTLLSNETLAIIDHLRALYTEHFGDATRVGGATRRDTLCYATQVNQDALQRALMLPLDAAFVIGGKNSSNTYQLFRLGAERLGDFAFFIQSEAQIHSLAAVEHYVFPAHGIGHGGHTEVHPLWPDAPAPTPTTPRRILITGGASCPDGLIQQVITRLNTLFAAAGAPLRPAAEVLAALERSGAER